MTTHRIDVGEMRQIPLTPQAVITRHPGQDTCTICETLDAVPNLAIWRITAGSFTDETCDMHLLDAVVEALPPRTMT